VSAFARLCSALLAFLWGRGVNGIQKTNQPPGFSDMEFLSRVGQAGGDRRLLGAEKSL
jgi:hypothetical protein